jgi:hypothetical protein
MIEFSKLFFIYSVHSDSRQKITSQFTSYILQKNHSLLIQSEKSKFRQSSLIKNQSSILPPVFAFEFVAVKWEFEWLVGQFGFEVGDVDDNRRFVGVTEGGKNLVGENKFV